MATKTMVSSSYVLGATTDNLIKDVYKIVYNKINSSLVTSKSKQVYPAFPDVDLDDSNSYPITILEVKVEETSGFTLSNDGNLVSINIGINATSASEADDLSNQIRVIVLGLRDLFNSLNFDKIRLVSSDNDFDTRDKIRVQIRNLTFNLDYVGG